MNNSLGDTIIIGAGGFGREVYSWAMDCAAAGTLGPVKGFLDSRKEALEGFNVGVGILDSVEAYEPLSTDRFVCAQGTPQIRKKYVSMMLDKGGVFTNLVHPTAVVGRSVNIGVGLIMAPFSSASAALDIGDYVYIGGFCSVTHHTRIGDWCQVTDHCSVLGRATLEEGVFLGAGAIIAPRVRVGAWSFVGAASLVIRNVSPRTKVFGVPAVKLGNIRD